MGAGELPQDPQGCLDAMAMIVETTGAALIPHTRRMIEKAEAKCIAFRREAFSHLLSDVKRGILKLDVFGRALISEPSFKSCLKARPSVIQITAPRPIPQHHQGLLRTPQGGMGPRKKGKLFCQQGKGWGSQTGNTARGRGSQHPQRMASPGSNSQYQGRQSSVPQGPTGQPQRQRSGFGQARTQQCPEDPRPPRGLAQDLAKRVMGEMCSALWSHLDLDLGTKAKGPSSIHKGIGTSSTTSQTNVTRQGS